MRRQIVALATLLAATSVARADRPAVCFIGRAECKTIALLESTWGPKRTLAGPPDSNLYWTGQIGLLANVSPHQSVGVVGGATFINADGDLHAVVGGRYRYWLSRYNAAEVSVAYIGRGAHGVRTEISVEAADQIGLVLGIDVYSDRNNTITEGTVALRFAGFSALPITLLGALVGGVGGG